MSTTKKIKPYNHAAGGWGALASTSKHLLKSENAISNIKALLKTNQDHGFDCPGCAWGEDAENKAVRFCENGAKAVNWEATSRRVTPEFFAQHSVSWLKQQDDYFLEYQGRLTHPMQYNAATDHYEPISWDDAFALIGRELNALESPDQAEFYTSGRTSNEAAFLYQLFVRSFGTNNFPDCSNMCHEASGTALKQAIGVGKGTVHLEDFEQTDCIFVFGQNPGTNHPRMLDVLSKASRRGARIVTFNPLKERGLERFTNPQHPKEMLTNGSTPITGLYLNPNLGGDMAAVRGMVKVVLEAEQKAQAAGMPAVLDHEFLGEHTEGMDDYLARVHSTSWDQIVEQSGLTQQQIEDAANHYLSAERVICTWAMGLTQHRHSVATIQEITNLMLLRGQIGKPGAGLCPVRGHSNVQGDRTMGINEKVIPAFHDKLDKVFDIKSPRSHGHNTVQAIQAMLDGKSRAFIGMGGNFAAATPDTPRTEQALQRCRLTVNVATKLNRTHLQTGEHSLILPCLGRTERDMAPDGRNQHITVEDSFSMVHASSGTLKPASEHLLSEPAIVAGMAQATLAEHPLDWQAVSENYDKIRDYIEQVVPGFYHFNHRLGAPGGFYLGNSAGERVWQTETGKARLYSHDLPDAIIPAELAMMTDQPLYVLQTMRSHDQYNTTVYGLDDRYRGVYGQRKVLFISQADLSKSGLTAGDKVDIESLWTDGVKRKVSGFTLVEYDIPPGNLAAYFPETNPLVPLDSFGELSYTPTSKAITVVLHPHHEGEQLIATEGRSL